MASTKKATSKDGKLTKKQRAFNLLLNLTGAISTNKGLHFLAKQDFMQLKPDAAPDAKNYKPLIVTSLVTIGSGAGSIFVPNEYLAAFLQGMSSGSAVQTWDVTAATFGIGAAPKSEDVKRYMTLYDNLNKASVSGTDKEVRI